MLACPNVNVMFCRDWSMYSVCLYYYYCTAWSHLCKLSLLCSDETQYRNCIVWLEDQKIRHYKIEERGNLRNIPSSDWPKAFHQVRHFDMKKTPAVLSYCCELYHEWSAISCVLLVPAGPELSVRRWAAAGGSGLVAGPGCKIRIWRQWWEGSMCVSPFLTLTHCCVVTSSM